MIECYADSKKKGKREKKRLRRSYFSSPEHSLIRCLRRWLRQKDEGHRNRMGKGTERAMDRAVALRRCSVTGYIPSIPRGHGHISSSSRFPVPHTPGLPTPARGTRAGTRNNGARVGTGPPVAPLNFPRFGFWFTSTSRRSRPRRTRCKRPGEEKLWGTRCTNVLAPRVIMRMPRLRPSWYGRHRWRRHGRAFTSLPLSFHADVINEINVVIIRLLPSVRLFDLTRADAVDLAPLTPNLIRDLPAAPCRFHKHWSKLTGAQQGSLSFSISVCRGRDHVLKDCQARAIGESG